MKKRGSFIYYTLIIFIILICFPKSYIDDYSLIRHTINILKLFFGSIICLLYLFNLKKNGVQKITLFFFIFIIIAFASTFLNDRDLSYFLKVYFINLCVLFCVDLSFKSKYKDKILKFIGGFLYLLLVVNFTTVILKCFLKFNLYKSASTYFLGMDNRFILFIIPCLLVNNTLSEISDNKKYSRRTLICYIIGTLSLLFTWSVASFLIMLLLGIFLKLSNIKKMNINPKFLLIVFFAINYLVVVLKVQNIFSDFIVNTLHKSITLSYRTILWDNAIKMIKEKPILGLGYFNTETIIPIYLNGGGVNHLHNLLVDIIFSSGLLGLVFYTLSLIAISKNINSIKDRKFKNKISLLFLSLLLYLIFESFELYPIYYFILCLFYYTRYIEGSEINEKNIDNNTKL